MIYTKEFPVKKLTVILTLLEFTYFEENCLNVRKTMFMRFKCSNKSLNATLRQNLHLKGNFGLALKMR